MYLCPGTKCRCFSPDIIFLLFYDTMALFLIFCYLFFHPSSCKLRTNLFKVENLVTSLFELVESSSNHLDELKSATSAFYRFLTRTCALTRTRVAKKSNQISFLRIA